MYRLNQKLRMESMFKACTQNSRLLTRAQAIQTHGLPICLGLMLCLFPRVPAFQDDSSTPKASNSSLQLRGNPESSGRGFQVSPDSVVPAFPAQPTVPPKISPAMMDEINAIRAQLGGGIGEQLKGMFDDDQELNLEFQKQLKRQGQVKLPPSATYRQVATEPKSQAPPVPRVSRLRSVARLLDQAAADLEELEMYQDADRIREQAQQYRQMARGK